MYKSEEAKAYANVASKPRYNTGKMGEQEKIQPGPSKIFNKTSEKGDLRSKESLVTGEKVQDVKQTPRQKIGDVNSTFKDRRKLPVVTSQETVTKYLPEKKDALVKGDGRFGKLPEYDPSEIPVPFRMIEKRSSLTDLKNLLSVCPPPQPELNPKEARSFLLDKDEANLMLDQVGKIKNGMEKLQKIIEKFHSEEFKNDIDFLVANVDAAFAREDELKAQEDNK